MAFKLSESERYLEEGRKEWKQKGIKAKMFINELKELFTKYKIKYEKRDGYSCNDKYFRESYYFIVDGFPYLVDSVQDILDNNLKPYKDENIPDGILYFCNVAGTVSSNLSTELRNRKGDK